MTVISPSGITISESDLELKCDVSELNDDNKYQIATKITGNSSSWVYGKYTATIELKKE
jgi:hypothetical protein